MLPKVIFVPVMVAWLKLSIALLKVIFVPEIVFACVLDSGPPEKVIGPELVIDPRTVMVFVFPLVSVMDVGICVAIGAEGSVKLAAALTVNAPFMRNELLRTISEDVVVMLREPSVSMS